MATSFSGGRIRSILGEPPTMGKQLIPTCWYQHFNSQSMNGQTLIPVAVSTTARKCTTKYAVLCRLCLKTYSKCYFQMNLNTNSSLIWEAVDAFYWYYWYVAHVKGKEIFDFSIQRSKGNIICYLNSTDAKWEQYVTWLYILHSELTWIKDFISS